MKIECKCKNCGNCFLVFPYKLKCGRGIYCSRSCSDKGKFFIRNRVNVLCEECGVTFETTPSRLNHIKLNYKKRFCSDYCRIKNINKSKNVNMITSLCEYCNQKFNTTLWNINNGKKFCSMKCKLSGCKTRHKEYDKRTEITCNRCKTKFSVVNSRIKYGYGKFCSKKCYQEQQSDDISHGIIKSAYETSANKGYYFSKFNGDVFYYDSSYELVRMKQLDDMGLIWTKKHGIKIKYVDYSGNTRYYIPDFLVGGNIVEEIKPSKLLTCKTFNVPLKIKAAKIFCKENNLIYRIITEKDLKIKL